MRSTQKIKICIDILITLALLFLMGYQFWGNMAHEWAGIGMFLFLLLHHVFNRKWHKNLLKGKYHPFRIFQIVLNAALFAAMACMMVSGILLSNYIFAFLPIHGGISLARLLHMASVYWGFVLMSVHLGLHWMIFVRMAKKQVEGKIFLRGNQRWIIATGFLYAAYGCFTFLKRGLPTYMFVQTKFVFLDFQESKLLFYLDYIAMMSFFILVGHVIANKLLKGRISTNNHKNR